MEHKPSVDAGYYLKRRFSDPTDKERGAQPFYLRSIHNFYQKFSGFWNTGSAKLLEYGGGPVIYSLISAAPFVSEVTFADYQQTNIDEVLAWKNCSKGHHDWTPYFKYVISQLEGNDSDEGVVQRQDELRAKCKEFLCGNLLAKNVLSSDSEPSDGFYEKFDIVSSNFCCDVVATDVKEYQSYVQSVGELVKPGGFIISLVSLEESYWHTSYSDERLFHLYLTKDDAEKAYSEAGFDIVYTDIHYLPESAHDILNDAKAIMFIGGQKKKRQSVSTT